MRINLIWDMDGTLIDSYDSIVDRIVRTIENFNISYDKALIREMIQKESTSYFFEYVSNCYEIEYSDLWDCYNSLSVNYSYISLMPHAKEVLEILKDKNVNNYIYTHRGSSANDINEMLDIKDYFIETVTIDNGFKRKPDPEAINYLVDKYKMDNNHTYYVGDRLIDQKCAKNAGIKRIYYHSYKGIILNEKDYDYFLDDLMDIVNIINLD